MTITKQFLSDGIEIYIAIAEVQGREVVGQGMSMCEAAKACMKEVENV